MNGRCLKHLVLYDRKRPPSSYALPVRSTTLPP
jgi:hypothetical protein